MMKKWIAINLLLLATAAGIGWQVRERILRFNAENDVRKIVPVRDIKQRSVPEKTAVAPLSPKTYNPADFAVIPEKNLFSDTRTKDEKVEVAPPEPPPLTQKPILVGITIVDGQKTASILEPGVVAGPIRGDRSNRAQIKRIGDVYQGYTITDISSDQIVLESGTRKEAIPLYEGTKRPAGGKTPILATRIVPFGGGAAVISGPATPVRTAVTPAVINTPGGAQSGVQSVVIPGRSAQTSAPAASAAPPPSGSGSSTGGTTSPGTRVVRTPFGDIVRPAR